ncbi:MULTISPECIES: hypothetical protein [unclassified Sphingobacterium]|uniref:hypothetical protein n=1 Tax=unclassified Sphingobacterium TaxID=2609468 RepID=UPI001051F57F|nr:MULTISPECIES: hypothetical protein [unclassified Sphingobacterium]MCS3552562.1 hypothetical protein [Sphingobacterium sp. JUb21]TCR10676.1 hypothetical protein EDF66_101491 [Sphingobacterium sp. JUb20]
MEDSVIEVFSPKNFNSLKKYQNLLCLIAFINLSIALVMEFPFSFESIKMMIQTISLTLFCICIFLFILISIILRISKRISYCYINRSVLYLKKDSCPEEISMDKISLNISLSNLAEKDSYLDCGHFIEISTSEGKSQFPIKFNASLLHVFPESNVNYIRKSPILMCETKKLLKNLLNLTWATS